MQNSASLMASQSYFVLSFRAARSPLNTFSGMLASVFFFFFLKRAPEWSWDLFRYARANSVFWSRALNIPLPHSFVYPQSQEDVGGTSHTIETNPVNSNGEKGKPLISLRFAEFYRKCHFFFLKNPSGLVTLTSWVWSFSDGKVFRRQSLARHL